MNFRSTTSEELQDLANRYVLHTYEVLDLVSRTPGLRSDLQMAIKDQFRQNPQQLQLLEIPRIKLVLCLDHDNKPSVLSPKDYIDRISAPPASAAPPLLAAMPTSTPAHPRDASRGHNPKPLEARISCGLSTDNLWGVDLNDSVRRRKLSAESLQRINEWIGTRLRGVLSSTSESSTAATELLSCFRKQNQTHFPSAFELYVRAEYEYFSEMERLIDRENVDSALNRLIKFGRSEIRTLNLPLLQQIMIDLGILYSERQEILRASSPNLDTEIAPQQIPPPIFQSIEAVHGASNPDLSPPQIIQIRPSPTYPQQPRSVRIVEPKNQSYGLPSSGGPPTPSGLPSGGPPPPPRGPPRRTGRELVRPIQIAERAAQSSYYSLPPRRYLMPQSPTIPERQPLALEGHPIEFWPPLTGPSRYRWYRKNLFLADYHPETLTPSQTRLAIGYRTYLSLLVGFRSILWGYCGMKILAHQFGLTELIASILITWLVGKINFFAIIISAILLFGLISSKGVATAALIKWAKRSLDKNVVGEGVGDAAVEGLKDVLDFKIDDAAVREVYEKSSKHLTHLIKIWPNWRGAFDHLLHLGTLLTAMMLIGGFIWIVLKRIELRRLEKRLILP